MPKAFWVPLRGMVPNWIASFVTFDAPPDLGFVDGPPAPGYVTFDAPPVPGYVTPDGPPCPGQLNEQPFPPGQEYRHSSATIRILRAFHPERVAAPPTGQRQAALPLKPARETYCISDAAWRSSLLTKAGTLVPRVGIAGWNSMPQRYAARTQWRVLNAPTQRRPRHPPHARGPITMPLYLRVVVAPRDPRTAMHAREAFAL